MSQLRDDTAHSINFTPRGARPIEARTRRKKPRRTRTGPPVVRIVLGVLALVGLAFALQWNVSAVDTDRQFHASRACPAGIVRTDCRSAVPVVITGTSYIHNRYGYRQEYDTAPFGWVELADEDPDLRAAVHSGDPATVEIWRGTPIAFTANGRTVDTLDTFGNDEVGTRMAVIIAILVSFFILRSASWRQFRRRLGLLERTKPGTLYVFKGFIGLAVLATLATGAILLIAGITWGVAVVGLGVAALLFTVAVPHISGRVLHRFDAALSGTAP